MASETRRIFLSRGHAGHRLAMRAFLDSLTPGSEFLLLAPTRGAADEILQDCLAASFGSHRMTLVRLAALLAGPSMAARGLVPAGRLALEAVAARVVDICRKTARLEYYQPVLDTPGFPRALVSTVLDLRLEDVTAGGELATLAKLFDAQLAEHGLADLAAILELAATEALAGGRRLTGLPVMLVDPVLPSTRHARLLTAILHRAPMVYAAILADDTAAIAGLEAILGVTATSSDARGERSLDLLRARLFSAHAGDARAMDETTAIFSQPGEGLECVEIARRIRALARSGIRFDRTAILLRNPERYQPLVEEALRRAGIPGYFTRGTTRPDPAGRALLALLCCAQEGCSASRFAEYLSLGQTPQRNEHGAAGRVLRGWIPPDDELLAAPPEPAEPDAGGEPVEPVTPHRWERFLVDAAVVGGRERWARRLRGLEVEWSAQLAEAEDDATRSRLARRLDQLGELQRFALPVVEMLAALPKRAPWSEWIDHLTALAETALRRPDSVLSVLNELWPMRDVGPVTLDEVAAVLGERLRFLRREPPDRRYGCVFVGTIEEARGRCFDAVFLPGLAEGLFPRRVAEDPLLLDEQRRRLSPSLETRDRRVSDERLLLRIAAASGERFVVSYPRIDVAQGRPRVPSFYALEVVRAAEGRLPDLREFERRAAASAPGRLGWPAPGDPAEAIDDAEYDLALLDPLLHGSGAPRGGARYLVEVNPHLARSLRARWKRWSRAWSGADGLVDPHPEALAALSRERLDARPYSASSLERFSLCPYQFLLYAIHRLRPREDSVALERLDPLTRGMLFHRAQFELFRDLEQQRMLDFGAAQLPAVLDIADRVLDRVAAQYREDLAPAIPRVWRNEIEDVRVDLRGWLREMAQNRGAWTPHRFEFSFGIPRRPETDPRSVEDEVVLAGGARLHGAIDLVERRNDGALRVTDHKTGRRPEKLPGYTGGGTHLQPVLYGMAAEKLLDAKVLHGRLSYCTQRGGYQTVEVLLEKARGSAHEALRIIQNAVSTGFLPAAPRKDACNICDYRAVCGPYEEERVKRKPQDRIEQLIDLRNQP